jgi:hypothetical protein
MRSVLDVQFTFLRMSPTTTVGYLPHSALELHIAETINSASQLEALLQIFQAQLFPGNHDIVENSA